MKQVEAALDAERVDSDDRVRQRRLREDSNLGVVVAPFGRTCVLAVPFGADLAIGVGDSALALTTSDV
jgi:hypothetical protein